MQLYFYADQACTRPDPAGLYWRGVETVEVGTDSAVIKSAWVRWAAVWGPSTFRIVARDEAKALGEADYRRDYWAVPAQSRMITAEGRRDHPGVIVAVSLLRQAH